MAIGIEHVLDGMGVSTGSADGIPGIVDTLISRGPVTLPPPPPPPKRTPTRIGNLQPSKCIFKVNPVYPRIAREARVSGSVILEATIDEEGSVSEVKVLSGHDLLRDAAVQAVKQWKYSPTVLNGEPVPILATVTVIFNLR